MIILYGWLALVGILLLMLIIKLVLYVILTVKGLSYNWSSYNNSLLALAFIAFLPIGVIWYLIKRA